MRLHQAAFSAITLSIILSACGGGSAVTESDQVANIPDQETAVSNGSETIVIPPPKNGATSIEEPTTTTKPPATSTPVTSTPVRPAPTTNTPEPAEVFGAASLTTAAVSGDDVVLSWSQANDVPQGGYNIFIDGVNSEDLSSTTGTTATVQGLDLSVQHCFTVQARYTQATPVQFFTSNSRCTDAQQSDSDNQAPVITGNPTNSVNAGESYSFTPSATDSDNDNLTFSVTNLPAWAQFNNQTGTLSGSPTVDDVGDYNNIVITVSDGTDEDSLNAFAVTVNPDATASVTGSISLRWVAPTTRTDGSALNLSEIQGYCVYVGTTRNNLQMVADINEGDRTTYVLDNLDLGDYYVAVSVYDQQNNMSSYSNIVMKTAVN
ncbi:MAG: putative Ig domain-containing protein [Candidatus Thiodiazotropha endolucinida]|nr:putative Ig domain-containing protein [Candidatus Thiodiazotropha endolucinida]